MNGATGVIHHDPIDNLTGAVASAARLVGRSLHCFHDHSRTIADITAQFSGPLARDAVIIPFRETVRAGTPRSQPAAAGAIDARDMPHPIAGGACHGSSSIAVDTLYVNGFWNCPVYGAFAVTGNAGNPLNGL